MHNFTSSRGEQHTGIVSCNKLYLHKARKYSVTDFSSVYFILQPNDDNSNCGPIAAMVLFHNFLPEKIDYKIGVNQFRVFVINNLLRMLDSISTV